MKYKPLTDEQYAEILADEKRMCTPAQFIKAKFQPGISRRDHIVTKKETEIPAIKMSHIEDKDQLRSTSFDSMWSIYQDKEKGELILILALIFSEPNRYLKFCFQLNTKLKKLGVPPVAISTPQGVFLFEVMEPDEPTAEVLNWLNLLIQSNGEITLMDDTEPSVGLENITTDIPKIVLQMYGILGGKNDESNKRQR